MKTVQEMKEKKGSVVLVRVDFNVPFTDGATKKIRDPRRIDAALPTIQLLVKKGYKVVLLAHLGDAAVSLAPVASYLNKKIPTVFTKESLIDTVAMKEVIGTLPVGKVLLCENIRRYPGEEANDATFTKSLASLGDAYVNDAFSVSHRAHASVVGLPKKLPAYAGLQLKQEVAALSGARTALVHPFICMLGGAKFGTKIPLLKQFLTHADQVVVMGAILNSFYKTAGFEVGASVVEDGYETEIKKLLASPKVLLPVDVIVTRKGKKVTCTVDEVAKGDIIVDIGPQSVALITEKLARAKLVVWNGPAGWYEKGFTGATVALAEALKASKARVVVGGGDTGAVVETVLGTQKNLFVSTGGGATLDYLAKGTLPGLKALGK